MTKNNRCVYNRNMKTVIIIKTDEDTKKKAQKLAQELGVPLSTVINVYLRQFIRTREFSFSLAYSMSSNLEKIIAEAEKDIAEEKNISPVFENSKEAIAWLKGSKDESSLS